MKRYLLFSIITLSFFSIYSQKKERPPFPNSIIDIGVGAGSNYGMLGAKTVLGYKGSGILIGTGIFSGQFAYQVGLQASYKWFFANFCYGTYSSVTDGKTGETELANGFIAMGGGKINLIRSKKLFLELGLGYGWGATYEFLGGSIPISNAVAVVGIGYRIFNVKKKQKEPVDEWPVK